MPYGAMRLGNAEVISVLVRRLGRLVRLKRRFDGAAPVAQHRLDLVHAAMRSTLVDLACLDQADLAAAILARGQRGRPQRPVGRGMLDVWQRR